MRSSFLGNTHTPPANRTLSERRSDQRINQIYSNRSFTTKKSKSSFKKPRLSDLGVVQRNQEFLAKKEQKLAQRRKSKKDSETDGCTFAPKTTKSKRSYSRTKQVNKTTARSTTSSVGRSNKSYSDIHGSKLGGGNLSSSKYSDSSKFGPKTMTNTTVNNSFANTSEKMNKYLQGKYITKDHFETNTFDLTHENTLNEVNRGYTWSSYADGHKQSIIKNQADR